MKLSKVEKYLLTNQLRILEALYPDDAEELAVQREALERGYELIYGMDINHIFDDDAMTVEESKEVWDTMDMFISIEHSVEQVNSEAFKDFNYKRFAGYDGNNESKFMAFASYTVERLKRFTHLPMEKPDYFNSHMPVRDVYRRMLAEWREIPIPNRFNMNSNQLTNVLGAAGNTDNKL